MFQSFYFNLLMGLKNKSSVHCRNLHKQVPVRLMETNSITGQSVTANPLPASKNELIFSHTTAVEQEQDKTSNNDTQKAGFIPFFKTFFFFLYFSCLNYPFTFRELCGLKYRHLLFFLTQTAITPPCSLYMK